MRHANPAEKLAYTVKEACEASGLSRDTLYRKHGAGEITMIKAGRRTLIRADDLRRMLTTFPALPRNAA